MIHSGSVNGSQDPIRHNGEKWVSVETQRVSLWHPRRRKGTKNRIYDTLRPDPAHKIWGKKDRRGRDDETPNVLSRVLGLYNLNRISGVVGTDRDQSNETGLCTLDTRQQGKESDYKEPRKDTNLKVRDGTSD